MSPAGEPSPDIMATFFAAVHEQKISPARRGAVLSVLPDMPFDPEPYIP
jgi:hypothetical protein